MQRGLAQGHVRPAARIPWPGGGRVRRIWDYAKLFGALGLVLLLLLWPTEALSAAQGAMRTWAGSVGPSLFPFLALLPMLTAPRGWRCWKKGWCA